MDNNDDDTKYYRWKNGTLNTVHIIIHSLKKRILWWVYSDGSWESKGEWCVPAYFPDYLRNTQDWRIISRQDAVGFLLKKEK